MANLAVQLVWRCRTERGWRRFPVLLWEDRILAATGK
jgi:hypothetical protein